MLREEKTLKKKYTMINGQVGKTYRSSGSVTDFCLLFSFLHALKTPENLWCFQGLTMLTLTRNALTHNKQPHSYAFFWDFIVLLGFHRVDMFFTGQATNMSTS